ncbi:MAG: hypothetical protein ACXAC7_05830 [Candidatus Hodarchaeales archaeon]|jgi:hypothetical protein
MKSVKKLFFVNLAILMLSFLITPQNALTIEPMVVEVVPSELTFSLADPSSQVITWTVISGSDPNGYTINVFKIDSKGKPELIHSENGEWYVGHEISIDLIDLDLNLGHYEAHLLLFNLHDDMVENIVSVHVVIATIEWHPDVTFVVGQGLNEFIDWHVSSMFSFTYTIKKDGTSVSTGSSLGGDFIIPWSLSELPIGTHLFQLTVTDDEILDTLESNVVTVTVLPPPVSPPVIIDISSSDSEYFGIQTVQITFDDEQGADNIAFVKVRLYRTKKYTMNEATTATPTGRDLVEFVYNTNTNEYYVDQGVKFKQWSIVTVSGSGTYTLNINFCFAHGFKANNGLNGWSAVSYLSDDDNLNSGWILV